MAILTFRSPRLQAVLASAALVALTSPACRAQSPASPAPAASAAALPLVTVTGSAAPTPGVAGWGDVPLARLPLQASVFSADRLRDDGVQRVSDLTAFDPAVSDAYNAEGYYDYLTVRGFVLDNRFNFLRDGLPINAETSIPLDNKSQVDILKGTSGIQAGTSAPGGLVNVVVKRPLEAALRSVQLEWRQPGTVTGSVDLSQRFGTDNAFGMRLNAAAAHLDPMVRHSAGERGLFALAADWRVAGDTLLEVEIETSHRSQPSQPGFSMLGDTLPVPADPRTNLNDQPWSQPVVFDATTASLRWQQKLGTDWRFVAHAATQRLRTDDRLAFPYGCSAENRFDRYCSDGTFDIYDYRSENERRRLDALDLSLQGQFKTGEWVHHATAGALLSRVVNRFDAQTNNLVGTGNIDGTLITSGNPTPNATNTHRDEHTTELYVRDAIALTDTLTAWLGVRHTHLHRQSIDTDGSAATDYGQSLTAPFAALSIAYANDQLAYVSWGRGVESNVVPTRLPYANGGQVFTALSRQLEIGIKGAAQAWEWNVAAFDIERPRTQDFSSCDTSGNCATTTLPDGTQHHRGLEADLAWHQGPWELRGGAQWLHARVQDSVVASVDGRQPTNVPPLTLKVQTAYEVRRWPGLTLQTGLVHESSRMVLPDDSVSIPGWTRVDAGMRWQRSGAGTTTTWRAGVDNLFDRRAWRESPYEYSHVYLYPLAPRTLRVSVQVEL